MEKKDASKKSTAKMTEEGINHFLDLMNQRGLNTTTQRLHIAKIFFSMKGHHSLEEIYHKIHNKVPTIGQTTVYRTIKLLVEVGLAEELQVGDGFARYEVTTQKQHHDHLVCKECGKTVEFHLPEVEKIQNELAKEHGFTLYNHHHILIGICSNCAKSKAKSPLKIKNNNISKK